MNDMQAKIEEIALYLGKPWKVNYLEERSSLCFDIIDGYGRGLFIRLEKNKFRIIGTFPRHKTRVYGHTSPAIGVSAHRSAKAIAADLQRRLLPDYLKAYAKAEQAYAEEAESEQRKALIRQALLKISGGYSVRHNESVYFSKGAARIDYADTVSLTLRNLTPDQAIRIIATLKMEEREP